MNTYQSVDLTSIQQAPAAATGGGGAGKEASSLAMDGNSNSNKGSSVNGTNNHRKESNESRPGPWLPWVFRGFPTAGQAATRATPANVQEEPGHEQNEFEICRLVAPPPPVPLVANATKRSTQASVAQVDGNGSTATATSISQKTKTITTTCCSTAGTRGEPANNIENTPYPTAAAAAAANVVAPNKAKPLRGEKPLTCSHPSPPSPLPPPPPQQATPEKFATKLNPNGNCLSLTGISSSSKSLPPPSSSLIKQIKVNSIFRLQTLPILILATITLLLITNHKSPLLIAQANSLDLIGGAINNIGDHQSADKAISHSSIQNSQDHQAQQVSSSETEKSPTVAAATPIRDSNFLSNIIKSLTFGTTKTPQEPTTPVATSPPPPTTINYQITNEIFTTTTTTTTSSTSDEPSTTTDSEENERPSSEDDDDDAEGCEGLSANEPAKGKNLSDAERLVNLQSCIKGKVRRGLLGATRSGMEIFEKLSLSGGCTASLMGLMASLADIKSFAFKFLDASAKIPSGVMYGLLSDFGDFDQCLSARSNPSVPYELEAEEGAYSGKYCLMSAKLNYHITLEPNRSVPDGIMADGVLWDDLLRSYWLSKSPKGFQVGMCFPSRCTSDDLDQLYRHVAARYNVVGEIISCQDGLDLKRQYEPDIVQCIIIIVFFALVIVTLVGSFVDRYYPELAIDHPSTDIHQHQDHKQQFVGLADEKNLPCSCSSTITLAFKVLTCFSLAKNWKTFMRKDHHHHNISVVGKPARSDSHQRQQLTGGTSSSYETDVSELNKTVSKGISCSTLGAVQISDPSPDSEAGAGEANSAPNNANSSNKLCQLTVKIQPDGYDQSRDHCREQGFSLSHLAGLRLLVILWITIGHSFLYPSASNYQHYRSIINMNITRDSVWFATTNFTLGIDTLLYITGLLFVYKLSILVRHHHHQTTSHRTSGSGETMCMSSLEPNGCGIFRLISKKILRFWPTYVTVIAFAIVVPLFSDGPMWPEMVSKRLGASCRQNWWSNLLFINNFLTESEICLPSSWFVSVLMQLFFIGSVIVVLERRYSFGIAMLALGSVLLLSCAYSFLFSYFLNLRAPVIRMDESFVLDVDENIWRLYINIFNNLGPFLIGMAGGYILLKTQAKQHQSAVSIGHLSSTASNSSRQHHKPSSSPTMGVESNNDENRSSSLSNRKYVIHEILLGSLVLIIAILVLSSVFHQEYSRLWSSIYWSSHRIGWAIVTGYIIHNCATGKWKLLNDLLSLSTLTPLSKLVFIAYLVYPIYIHVHSGLVRDGLHVSIYNMFNIYTTRLVMTFITALLIHLLVELPFCSIEEIFLNRWMLRIENESRFRKDSGSKFHPLLAVAPIVSMQMGSDIKRSQQQVDNEHLGFNKQINLNTLIEDENSIGANKQSGSAA